MKSNFEMSVHSRVFFIDETEQTNNIGSPVSHEPHNDTVNLMNSLINGHVNNS